MGRKNIFGIWQVPCACVLVALVSCTNARPPQTLFYCIDIPEGRSPKQREFVQALGQQLGFKVSEATLAAEHGPPDSQWEVYGRGVSVFVGTSMKDGQADKFGNRSHDFNPNRLSLNIAKTGLWQNIGFGEVLTASKSTARQFGWSFTQAGAGGSCAT